MKDEVIYEGVVKDTLTKNKVLKYLECGDVFGEEGFFTGTETMHCARSVGFTTVMTLKRS